MSNPSLLSENFGSTFILGKSGSGKTTLIHTIIKKLLKQKKKIFTLNVKSSEYQTLSSSIKNIEFSALNNVPSGSVIVIEDVITLTTLQSSQIRHLLNYSAHHNRLKVFVISHHIFKTNTWHLLPYFNYIIFTGTQTNLPILRIFFSSFKIDKSTELYWLDQFSKIIKDHSYSYAHFDSTNQTFNVSTSLTALLDGQFKVYHLDNCDVKNKLNDVTTLQTRFDNFLSNTSIQPEASSIFSILASSVPASTINSTDLTLKVFSEKKKRFLHFSLIDYIVCLLTPKARVSSANKFLHIFFKDKCQIPLIFLKNVYFRQ